MGSLNGLGWERAESSSHSTRCHGQEHLPLEQVVRESRLSFGMGWSGTMEGGKTGKMAGTVGSATYNSQKPLREGPRPAANRSPLYRTIKGGCLPVSASFGHGGEQGWAWSGRRGPSTAILRRWGSPAARLRRMGALGASRPAAALQCASKAAKGSAALPPPSSSGRAKPGHHPGVEGGPGMAGDGLNFGQRSWLFQSSPNLMDKPSNNCGKR